MKKRILLMTLLSLASCNVGFIAQTVVPNNAQTAYAKKAKFKSKKLKSFPKAYRGTWHRNLGNGITSQLKITKKTLQNISTGSYVFPAKKQALKTKFKHGYTWLSTRDADNLAGTSFQLRTTKVKIGKKTHKALIEVRGSAYSMPITFYK